MSTSGLPSVGPIDRFTTVTLTTTRGDATRRAYAAVLGQVLADVRTDEVVVVVSGDDLAEVVERTWGKAAPATCDRNRAALSSFLCW